MLLLPLLAMRPPVLADVYMVSALFYPIKLLMTEGARMELPAVVTWFSSCTSLAKFRVSRRRAVTTSSFDFHNGLLTWLLLIAAAAGGGLAAVAAARGRLCWVRRLFAQTRPPLARPATLTR